MVVPFGSRGRRGPAPSAQMIAFKTALADVRGYMKNKAA